MIKPQWKKAGPNGEKTIDINGRKFKIDKNLDHNERHTGEWKVFEWDKKKREWVWVDTYSPQWHAKDMVMKMAGIKESATPLRTLKLINKIKQSGVVKTGSMKKEPEKKVQEEAPTVNTSVIPDPSKTAMGPKFKTSLVHDRRKKKGAPKLLKRFADYYKDKGIE